jgi:hypothetical protein
MTKQIPNPKSKIINLKFFFKEYESLKFAYFREYKSLKIFSIIYSLFLVCG